MPVRRLRRLLALTIPALITMPLAPAAFAGTPAAAGYSVQTLHFLVHIGPTNTETCDVIGDVYTPDSASPTHRVPAILTTNGFGGSKDDQAGLAEAFATHGYEALSYSGLGFGGSGCRISLDSPEYDGKAASQLVSYLGGAPGIAFLDAAHTQPAPVLDDVIHDATDHAGHHDAYDPRVGMVGGSYAGEAQFAAASVDPRIDTIVPMITWNDLSYSLAPNDTARTTGVSTSTPGAAKLVWGASFALLGAVDGVQNANVDLSRLLGCPNFTATVCQTLISGLTTGYVTPAETTALRQDSVASYLPTIRIPTLLIQGENDTLFNLNEASATYEALHAQGTPVKMIWQSWGHSDSTPQPGEFDETNPNPQTQYETARIYDWLDHYLKGTDASTGPTFAYYRDWIPYTGIATPAYGTSNVFPVGSPDTYHLSGSDALVASASAVTSGTAGLLTPPLGLPTSNDPLDVFASTIGDNPQGTVEDLPGTAAAFTSAALSAPLDVVGSPTVTITLDAPVSRLTQGLGPAGQLVLFAKLADVAPDGTATLIHGLIAPIRVPNVDGPVTITLPGIVHQFAAGHRVELDIASGSVDYRGGLVANPVTIHTGGATQTLTLPVLP